MCAGPKKHKKYSQVILFGFELIKASNRMLVKLTPDVLDYTKAKLPHVCLRFIEPALVHYRPPAVCIEHGQLQPRMEGESSGTPHSYKQGVIQA